MLSNGWVLYPLAACAGFVIAVVALWVRVKRPFQVDVTVRHAPTKEGDDDTAG